MRRKDREITDMTEIVKMIDECHVIRLGFADGDFPYIVPLNFGYEVTNNAIAFYVHGAMAGRKYELMKKNGMCSFEMDIPLKMECLYKERDVTMRYKSVMGTAEIELLEGEERQRAIDDVIMNRYDETRNFDYNRNVVEHTAVAKIKVIDIVGKSNPLGGGAD